MINIRLSSVMLLYIKRNLKAYLLMLLVFICGISAGVFTVNGLSDMQNKEMEVFLNGFTDLMHSQDINNVELLRSSASSNIRITALLWLLGASVIGIPLIFITILARGFITGFSTGIIIKTMGTKGIFFSLAAIFPKEIILIPFIIALGVNGIAFSLKIIKGKHIKNFLKQNLKTEFINYSFTTLFFCTLMLAATLLEAYILPVFIRMIQ